MQPRISQQRLETMVRTLEERMTRQYGDDIQAKIDAIDRLLVWLPAIAEKNARLKPMIDGLIPLLETLRDTMELEQLLTL